MSLTTFISTVETDINNAFHVVEADAETALVAIWNAAKPIFTAAEPAVIQAVLAAITSFLAAATDDVKGGSSDDIEQQFIETLETAGSALLTQAQGLGSNLLQMLIGLAKGAAL